MASSQPPEPPPPRPSGPWQLPGGADPKGWRPLLVYLILALALMATWRAVAPQGSVRVLPYSEFKERLGAGEVTECAVTEGEIRGMIDPGGRRAAASAEGGSGAEDAASYQETAVRTEGTDARGAFRFRTVRVEDPGLVEDLEKAGVPFRGERPGAFSAFLVAWALPILFMVGIWMLIFRRVGRTAGGMLSIGKSKARVLVDEKTGVTFRDVAGCDEAKLELQEIVDFLQNPDRYRGLGARIPKGALLVGPPGTGKTLLARAVAGEAGVPFFSLSGSEFVEMFVGVGAARVRDLFENAKQRAPCIVFIDELDAIGRQRGIHVGAANDEREQTLNQLLVEMDGFEANAGVILLSATNRPDVLDRALLRPGRFDRQIVVDAPDADGREAILKVHARNKPLHEDVDLRRVARATAGFSGADLANALNEAALLAARRSAKAITQADLEEAVEKVVAGPERRSRRLGEEEKRRVAVHEVGHALVSAFSPGADPVHKISIVPRGRAALGYTLQLPAGEQFLLTQSELFDRLCGLLGGRAAEEEVYGEVSTGAQNDLERATALARQMVCVYGMSEKVGLTHCARREALFLPGDDAGLQRDCSEEMARQIDEEVRALLDRAYAAARGILAERRQILDQVAGELLQSETIDARRFYELIGLPVPESEKKELPPLPGLPQPVAAGEGPPP